MTSVTEMPLSIKIRGHLPQLQPAMRRVGEIIAANPSRIVSMPISALASEAQTSETTVIRFCREMGVSGYAQLRLALATEMGARTREEERLMQLGDISAEDNIESVVEKIAFADVQSVAVTAKALSMSELAAVVKLVSSASRIDIYGVGASGLVAADLQQKLHRIGMVSFAFADAHQAISSAALSDDSCVAFGITHSGNTRDTLSALQLAGEKGAKTVAITSSPNSEIAKIADHTLLTAARETSFRAGATGSRLAQLMIVDCLFVAVAQHSFTRSIRALESTRDAAAHFRGTPSRWDAP